MVGQHTRWTAKRNRPENDPKEVRKMMIECGTVDLKKTCSSTTDRKSMESIRNRENIEPELVAGTS